MSTELEQNYNSRCDMYNNRTDKLKCLHNISDDLCKICTSRRNTCDMIIPAEGTYYPCSKTFLNRTFEQVLNRIQEPPKQYKFSEIPNCYRKRRGIVMETKDNQACHNSILSVGEPSLCADPTREECQIFKARKCFDNTCSKGLQNEKERCLTIPAVKQQICSCCNGNPQCNKLLTTNDKPIDVCSVESYSLPHLETSSSLPHLKSSSLPQSSFLESSMVRCPPCPPEPCLPKYSPCYYRSRPSICSILFRLVCILIIIFISICIYYKYCNKSI